MDSYVHGFTERESQRLHDQAATVLDIIHHGTTYPAGNLILEAGCGVGAQTVTLAQQSPESFFVSIDRQADSLAQAKALIEQNRITNVSFRQADIYDLPFEAESFDHVFVCFVLEHLPEPETALSALKRVVKKGGSITVVEGDHGSCYFHPSTPEARRAWQCLIDVQETLGGDSLIGRRLFHLVSKAGFKETRVSPRMVYCDPSRPALMDGFVGRTIVPMVAGVENQALEMGLIDPRRLGPRPRRPPANLQNSGRGFLLHVF